MPHLVETTTSIGLGQVGAFKTASPPYIPFLKNFLKMLYDYHIFTHRFTPFISEYLFERRDLEIFQALPPSKANPCDHRNPAYCEHSSRAATAILSSSRHSG